MRGDTMSAIATDRAMFDEWVGGQLRWIEEQAGITGVWEPSKLRASGRVFPGGDADMYRGPWLTVRPYLREEVIHLVESGRLTRWTVTQWLAAQSAVRIADEGNPGSMADHLSDLAYIRDQYPRRGEIIARARAEGASWKQVCEATGLSRAQANKVLDSYVRASRLVADDEPF
jgi:hypothetical protein